MIHLGPKYGYFPNARKTVLILKTPELINQAKALFRGSGIVIKTDGHKYLGAAIGSSAYKNNYVREKIKKWVQDVEELSLLAVEEPQVALSA